MAHNVPLNSEAGENAMSRKRATRLRTPRERRVRLYTHLVVFVIVNAGLTTLNLVRRPEKLWFYWPLLGWGAGVALHAWIAYRRRDSDTHINQTTSSSR